MGPLGALAVLGAGFVAGTINTVVGSGSLVTFPVLVGLGYSRLIANVSNTVGLTPGSASGVVGYRRELAGQRDRVLRLGGASLAGGLTGGLLLLSFPSTFSAVVPWLVIFAALLMAAQPRLSRRLRARRTRHDIAPSSGLPLLVGVFLTGVYGGYFGAAQGVILLALLGVLVDDDLQRLNALKNVLAAVVNGVAAVLFMSVSHVAWGAAGLLALGAVVGGQVGAAVARRVPAGVLRAVIVVGGVTVGVILAVR